MFVSTLVMVTAAPGTAAPLLSVTVPTIDPVVVWAAIGSNERRKQIAIPNCTKKALTIDPSALQQLHLLCAEQESQFKEIFRDLSFRHYRVEPSCVGWKPLRTS